MKEKSAQHIIIVGAGAAGLMAARELSPYCKITILEARDQPGGRIRTIYKNGSAMHLEGGAEFIHGELPLTFQLLKEAGLSCSHAKGNIFNVKDGKWEESDEIIEGWEELLDKMKKEKEDISMLSFLNKYYASEKDHTLRHHIGRFAEGFDLADINRVSLKALLEEWTNETTNNFRIDKGYMSLIRFLENECIRNGCSIYTNTAIKLIEWKEGSVRAYKDPQTVFDADKIIITIPLGLLQSRQANDAISFVPSLDAYLDATQQMGYGSVIKFILEFSEPFWNRYNRDIGFIISDEKVPTWWPQAGNETAFTGWLGGPPADELSNTSKEELLQMALHSLANIFKMKGETVQSLLNASHVFNWARDEWAGGGYSYVTPSSAQVRQLFNTAPGNAVYFAGEAFYEGPSPGTVEAALISGKNIAGRILKAK
ncbi:MAG TPA: NAD(P)/FAD-dependent oxidoreductase [Chitinophagaceae bacterium]|nr:NAD(P)/FAD-dependent oxidoreductase [Chitinophagaceae bacterium]